MHLLQLGRPLSHLALRSRHLSQTCWEVVFQRAPEEVAVLAFGEEVGLEELGEAGPEELGEAGPEELGEAEDLIANLVIIIIIVWILGMEYNHLCMTAPYLGT